MGWEKGMLEGVWIFEPIIWQDERGYFTETFNYSGLPEELQSIHFVQDNEAKSSKGVLRGLHYQLPPYAQSKLVRCIQGSILDVIIDIRPKSSTFGEYLPIHLDEVQKRQLYVPQGFAHGYVVLSNSAIVAYKCDNLYHPEAEGGICYNDPDIDIDWKLPDDQLIVSAKDKNLPILKHHLPFLAR